ncbi:PA2778 family cysteine peptidase [Alcanivorax sp.]|uniref:PA2778 family cysteine peptidase n=1 Tax=Alcanivorax sp. TaxID=1872427 RepID=UPI0025C48BB7|nr:PA2778 family cysteine peptidase [Alcanivorax sp.]
MITRILTTLRWQPVRPVVIAALLFLLAACQTLPPPEFAQQQPEHQLDVPFVAQEKYQCGPASLAMMLQWAGKPDTAEALVDEVWLPQRQGSLGIELKAAARSRGLLAYPVEDEDSLFREIQAGRPVLVLQNLALKSWPKWHFAVVTGYDKAGKTIILHSGTTESDRSHWNRFIRTWARADRWGFTLVQPGELPASATAHGLFRAISAAPNGESYWPVAVEAFPQSGELWFGYGNSLWGEQQREAALHAFQQAVMLKPDFSAAWNNLAYAQQALGHEDAARQSLCQALALSPDDPDLQDTALDLGYSCPVETETD